MGNIRDVKREGSNDIIQRTEYLPFGTPFKQEVGDAGAQRYKFGGKEFDQMHNLNMYDSHARQYDPLLGRFHSVDPKAESYPWLSPYVYCGNNPILNIDPTGEDYWSTNDPSEIKKFINAMGDNDSQFDFSSNWEHATDKEFVSSLTYDDEKGMAIFP